MARVLTEAGVAPWLVQEAKNFTCALCNAQKGARSAPIVASKHSYRLGQNLLLDYFFVWLQRLNEEKTLHCFLSVVDEATALLSVYHISAVEAADATPETVASKTVKHLEEKWLSAPGPGAPEQLFVDNDRIFNSVTFQSFCAR